MPSRIILGGALLFFLIPVSFHPETVLSPNFDINLHPCVCGVDSYASVQVLDFLNHEGKVIVFPMKTAEGVAGGLMV